MSRVICFFSAAVLILCTTASLASPLGLSSFPAYSESESPVQLVHSWHCKSQKGWYKGKKQWHRHTQACRKHNYSGARYRTYPPLPYYDWDEWQWERRTWLWD